MYNAWTSCPDILDTRVLDDDIGHNKPPSKMRPFGKPGKMLNRPIRLKVLCDRNIANAAWSLSSLHIWLNHLYLTTT